jgi:hypothetical protein
MTSQDSAKADARDGFHQGRRVAIALAELIEREMGYPEGYIDPVALRLFIKLRWKEIEILGNMIQECE